MNQLNNAVTPDDRDDAFVRAALEDSERKYRELVDEAATIILRWDIHGNVTFFNEYAQGFFGFTEAEIVGRNVVGTIVPETEFTGRDLANLMKEICRDPSKFEYNENENIKRNGERVWIAWKNRPIYNEAGELYEILSIGIDITDRKNAEDALRASEEKLKLLVDQENLILWSLNKELYFTSSMGGGLQKLGLQPNEIVNSGLNIYQFFKTESRDYPPIKAHLQALEGKSVSYESQWRDRHFQTYVTPQKDKDGNITGCIGMAIDITERKRSEQRLSESEATAWALLNMPSVLTLLINEEGIILDSNVPMANRFGKSREEFIGLRLWDLLPPNVLKIRKHHITNTLRTGKVERWEDCREGAWFETCSNPVFDEQGQIKKAAIVAYDITERKQNEEELKQYRDQLERLVKIRTADLEASNNELESYSYSIAHDLRSPLRTITSFSQILRENVQDQLDAENREHLERIIKSGVRMSDLIDDILELSRITRCTFHPGTVNLSELANEISIRLEQAHPERNVQWQVQENLIVKGDERLLEVALQNLIENAWKYTRDRSPAVIELGKRLEGKKTVMYIKDNGVGFEMKYVNKLFKPFNRLHSLSEFEGTGIGLATVQRILDRHGGRIWVEAEKDRGAAFFFYLPSTL